MKMINWNRLFLILFIDLFIIHSFPQVTHGGFLDPRLDDSQYLDSLIYQPLPYSGMCVRLLSLDGPFGCASAEGGDSGALLWLDNLTDPKAALATLRAEDFAPLVVMLPHRLFSAASVDLLAQTGLVAGLLVVLPSPQDLPPFHSPVSQTPNQDFYLPSPPLSPSKQHPSSESNVQQSSKTAFQWNPHGSSFAFRNLPFPVAAIDNATAQSHRLLDKARANLDPSTEKWAVEISAAMWAVGDAALCLRRGHCDPLGGQSVFTVLNPSRLPSPAPSLHLTTRLDSYAFFQQLARGADSAVSGVAALLATFDALSRQQAASPRVPWRRQLVAALFTGESWGNIGSKRFVADLQGFSCRAPGGNGTYCKEPYKYSLAFQQLLHLGSAELLVDLQQVGGAAQDGALFVHAVNANASEVARKVAGQLVSNVAASSRISIAPHERVEGLPPSSAFAYLQALPELPALVVTDHEREFTNPYYQSELESDAGQIDAGQICGLASRLSRSLYLALTGLDVDGDDSDGDDSDREEQQQVQWVEANCTLVEELIGCLLVSPGCDLVRRLVDPTVADGVPAQSTYTSVFQHMQTIQFVSEFAHAFLVDRNQQEHPLEGKKCKDKNCPAATGFRCVADDVCMHSPTFFHDAYSPAFEYDSGQGGWVIVNTSEPTFVESTWEQLSVRLFIRNSFWAQMTLFGFGIFQFIVFLFLLKFLKTYIYE